MADLNYEEKDGGRSWSVMIVDDEQQIIDYLLRSIEWEKLPYKICGTFTSSIKALAYLECTHSIDIIITDIQMPGMDGLEFCNRVTNINPDIKIVLLTAYPTFEYAHKAMNMEITSYILKHELNPELLISHLEKLAGEIIRKKKRSLVMRRSVIEELLVQTLNVQDRVMLKNSLFSSGVGEVVLLMLRLDYPLLYDKSNEQSAYYQLELTQTVSRIEVPYFKECSIDAVYIPVSSKETLCFLLPRGLPISQLERHKIIYAAAHSLQDQFHKHSGESLSILYTDEYLSADFVRTAERMKQSSAAIPFFGKNMLLDLNDVKIQGGVPETPEIDFKSVDFHTGQKQVLLDFKLVCKTYDREQLFEVIAWLKNFIRHSETLTFPPVFTGFEVLVRQCCTTGEIEEIFKECCSKLDGRRRDISSKTARAIEFIQKNYKKDLSVEEIAVYIHTSGTYIQKLFKHDTNITITKYIRIYKINIAVHMLQSGKYNVGHVADELGYTSSQYFSKVFRKVTGRMPTEYINYGK